MDIVCDNILYTSHTISADRSKLGASFNTTANVSLETRLRHYYTSSSFIILIINGCNTVLS